jgi:hypothetical protein
MAKLEHIGPYAIKIIARLEARKAVKERMRLQGIKHYRHVDMLREASEYLSQHPELFEVALARAWELSVAEQAERIDKTNYDDQRRKPGCEFNLKRRSSVS